MKQFIISSSCTFLLGIKYLYIDTIYDKFISINVITFYITIFFIDINYYINIILITVNNWLKICHLTKILYRKGTIIFSFDQSNLVCIRSLETWFQDVSHQLKSYIEASNLYPHVKIELACPITVIPCGIWYVSFLEPKATNALQTLNIKPHLNNGHFFVTHPPSKLFLLFFSLHFAFQFTIFLQFKMEINVYF